MMKNLQKLFSMAMLVCMAVTLFSCSKDEEEASFAEVDIMGSWTISSSELKINGVSDSGLSSFYSEGSTFEIMDDKNYKVSKGGVAYEEGTWSFDGKKTFSMTDAEDDVTSYQIQSLSKESLVLYSYQAESLLGIEITSEETINMKK